MSIILVRHAESLWNKENKFTGLIDVELSPNGIHTAKELASLFTKENINFDYVFSSNLKRAIDTALILSDNDTSTKIISSNLNERDYGDLTGMNKKEALEVYGSELFQKIRRGFETKPPNGESLEDVTKRVGIYYDDIISKNTLNKNILIVAHGNSLRALLVHLNIFNNKTIENFEINSCVPIVVNLEKKEISYINKFKLHGLQILDSRGYPTIQVNCINKITNKIVGKGSTPSGASCGSTEVLELRDCDKNYFMGKSVLKAIDNLDIVNKYLQLNDHTIKNLRFIDKSLIDLDPSDFKDKLGGNLITAISFCMANTASNLENLEIYEYIFKIYNTENISQLNVNITPLVNIINGGKHGVTDNLKIQEFMIFANESYAIPKKIQIITEVYHSLKTILSEKYGPGAKSIGDEGGFCPPITSTNEALNNILEAIKKSNYVSGQDVFLALDCASSEFYNVETKLYEIEKGLFISSDELIDYYGKLINEYPALKSIEDGFHEKDYDAWTKFTNLYGDKIMIVGDDLFTSNPKLIKKGIDNKLANTLLLKVNQIGTITEAIEGAQMMFNNGLNVIVSHRSGETNHSYIIDIAKGIGAKYVKIGSPCRGERIEKFNRLLEIETIYNK